MTTNPTTTRLPQQIVLNTVFAAGLVWAWFQGYVQFVFSHDVSRISYVIAALLVISIALVFRGKISHLERVEVWLVTLGLIGNVVGFIIALQKIDIEALGTADGVRGVASSLLAGMGVAFCSTLVGAISALWVSVMAWIAGGEEQ